ncbi:MAG: phosphate starvation-inducible protein PhoH, partial [Tissierellia bacterium]|nr:phosphate starvation-inducible protein PhoH [Tissierellia bacterium]
MQIQVQIPEYDFIPALFGSLDRRKKWLEDAMDVRMGQNDSELLLEGEEPAVRRARRVIDSLQQQYSRERSLDEQQIRYAVDMAHKEADDEIHRLMNEILLVTQSGRSLKAKTQGQARYIRAIRENDIVFGIGPAGTGKTYLAMAMAVDA